MAARTLVAYANGRRVGIVSDDSGIWSFTYDKDWLAREDAFELSPAFPLAAGSFVDGSSQRPVQWFFDNLLPEEEMRIALAREARVEAGDAWGLLAYYGRESAGALTLLAEGEHEASGGLQPLSYANLEARIQAMPQHALTATAPKRMSAAGAQQKRAVHASAQARHAEHGLSPFSDQRIFLHAAGPGDGCARAAHALHTRALGLLRHRSFRP
jgi:serine/threonine-protein kinase HipA